jgi:acyl carrier protein
LEEFLPGENPAALEDATPLITGGILDSISTVKLVSFLEEKYDIEFNAHEISVDNLNTLADITRIVDSKL